MAFWRLGLCACILAAPLCASTINVSTQESVTLQSGDTLIYSISAYSYLVHAQELGGPADPSIFAFYLPSNPLVGTLDLRVSLESYGGGFSAPVTNASQEPGYVDGTLYQGPVSGEFGSLMLSPGLSGELFSGPAVLLEVQNLGSAVTLGLEPYTLLQSLQVTLVGTDFSVGGVVAAAKLQEAPGISMMAMESDSDEVSDAPEPLPGVLLALGIAGLAAGARLREPGFGMRAGSRLFSRRLFPE